MTHIILYLTTALELVLVAWGKQQHSPVLPSPSTFTSDPITIKFTQSAFSVLEIDGPAEPVLALSRSSNYTISVKVRVTDGTAKGGLDYVKFDNDLAEVIFPAGSIYAVLEVKIIDDKLFEGRSSEVFNLAIVNASLPYGVEFEGFSSTNAVVTILDDDFPYITFGNSDYTVGENDTLHVNITLSHASVFDMTVTVYATTVNATESDFAFGSYEVDIPANSKEGLLSISITNDTVFEFNKTFLLIIEDGSLPQLVRAGTPRIATVTIVDDEGDCVNFGQANYTVYEDDNLLEILVEIESGKKASTDIFMQIVDMRSTAESGTDYESGPFNVTIKQGEFNATFYVEIINDSVYENDEDFSLAIIADSLKPDNLCLGHTIKAKVTIADDEYVLTFGENTYVFQEDKAKLSLSVSRPLRENITVTFTYFDFTATGNYSTNDKKEIDYYASNAVTFPAHSTKIEFTLNIVDDSRLESNELFRIIANPPEVPSGQTPPSAGIIIRDDDDFRITFEMDHYVIDKNKVDPIVKLLLWYPEEYIGSIMFPINVTVDKVNATTGDAENVAFIFQSYSLSFEENETEKALIIHSIDNSIVESNETCILIINQDSITTGFDPRIPNSRIIAGEYSRAMITIVNDDDSLKLIVKANVVPEDSGKSANFCLVLGRPARENISVIVLTIGINASENADFIPGPFAIIIPKGKDTVEFSIAILDDEFEENNETFYVLISNINLPENLNLLDPKISTVMILDNDVRCSFEESSYIVNEGDSLSVLLILTKSIYKEVPVRIYYDNDEDTGIQNDDYDNSLVDYVIPQSETNSTFTIQTHIDALFEKNETFDLVVVLPEQDTTCRTTITIVDNTKENCSITMIQGSFKYNRNRRRTTFRFSSDGDPKAKYKCKLDKGKFDECKSPMVWKNLRRGKHTVTVRAVCTDDEGKRLATAKRKFKFIVL